MNPSIVPYIVLITLSACLMANIAVVFYQAVIVPAREKEKSETNNQKPETTNHEQ